MAKDMRKPILFLVAVIIAVSASAEVKLKDVPDDHWAASAIYDLVKMGVTKGYPDGTFRGTKQISRYETAVFLSKLAKAIGAEDLKADIKALKDEIVALKKEGALGVSGSYRADWKLGNLLTSGSTQGAVACYRLILSSTKNLGEGANVKVNLDTMDYGWGSTSGGVLATELLDIESNLKLNLAVLGFENPVDLKLTYGPGPKQHADASGVLASENGTVIKRPDTAVMASTSLFGADVSGGYIVQSKHASGRVDVNQLTGSLGLAFENVPLVNNLRLTATGDYLSTGMFSSSARDLRATIALAAPLGSRINASGTLGLGGSAAKNVMVAADLALNDVWETGTVAIVKVARLGSAYLDTGVAFGGAEFDLAGLDRFNRPLENATVNLGGEVIQSVSPDIKLVGKGELRLDSDYQYTTDKGRLTAEGGISYTIAPNTSLDALYRLHQDKSTGDTSDVAALGLLYNF